MAWQEHIDFDHCDLHAPSEVAKAHSEPSMTPGLTNTYDEDLREKAGVHTPPPPPECMGLEGEYDNCGLVRRVAQAFDQNPHLAKIDTLTLTQHGGTISLAGQIEDWATLEAMVEVASLVDGTRSVDTKHVYVGQ